MTPHKDWLLIDEGDEDSQIKYEYDDNSKGNVVTPSFPPLPPLPTILVPILGETTVDETVLV